MGTTQQQRRVVTIGSLIAAGRNAAGLTQVDLAEKSGISNVVISQWEGGVRVPDLPNLQKLAKALGPRFVREQLLLYFT